jgi:C4-dicarboxylate-specific signal transduction histidine kinase
VGAFKRVMGIDVVDFGIQTVVTFCVAVLADTAAHTQSEGLVAIVFAASLIILGVRRQRALSRRAQFPQGTGEVAAARLDEVEERLADLEQGQARMQELEERLDFAERLLSRQNDVRAIASREEP